MSTEILDISEITHEALALKYWRIGLRLLLMYTWRLSEVTHANILNINGFWLTLILISV